MTRYDDLSSEKILHKVQKNALIWWRGQLFLFENSPINQNIVHKLLIIWKIIYAYNYEADEAASREWYRD